MAANHHHYYHGGGDPYIGSLLHQQPQPLQQHAGAKRHADDELEQNAGISKEFKRLRINNTGHLHPLQYSEHTHIARTHSPEPSFQHRHNYPLDNDHQHYDYTLDNTVNDITIPYDPPPAPVPTPIPMTGLYTHPNTLHQHHHLPPIFPEPSHLPPPSVPLPPPPTASTFHPPRLTTTNSHTIYIPSLDDELDSDSSSPTSPSHTPDPNSYYIPPSLLNTKIPSHILRPHLDPSPSNQLILYKDPTSISVPAEEDAVRKAIVEARRRARERVKSLSTATTVGGAGMGNGIGSGIAGGSRVDAGVGHIYGDGGGYDPDAMDLG